MHVGTCWKCATTRPVDAANVALPNLSHRCNRLRRLIVAALAGNIQGGRLWLCQAAAEQEAELEGAEQEEQTESQRSRGYEDVEAPPALAFTGLTLRELLHLFLILTAH